MKYVIAILLVSFLLITACGTREIIDPIVDDPIVDDPIVDDPIQDDDLSDDEIIDEIMPELVDPDEEIEIGEMI